MPSATIPRARPRATRTRRSRARSVWTPLRASAAAWRLTRRTLAALRRAPLPVRIIGSAILLAALWASVNWIVQTARKPTEMFFPVSGALAKTPAATWREYGPLFVKHSTAVITPELLAALAQVEGSGNPVA